MGQLTSKERQKKGLSLTDSRIKIMLKESIHPFLRLLSKTKLKYKVQKMNSLSAKVLNLDSKRPIIFVCNHGTSFDAPIALGAIKEHTYLLVGKQPLESVDEAFFNLNGTIFVDRKDKDDMQLSKDAIIELLGKKKNILVYPEGTWNMTDSNLMHEMKWGMIEIAMCANALIVPLALDYDYDTRVCKYKFGEAFDVNELTLQEGQEIKIPQYSEKLNTYIAKKGDTLYEIALKGAVDLKDLIKCNQINSILKEGIDEVRDRMATLRWDLFETRQTVERKNIDIEKEREKIMHSVEEYPKLDYEYEKSVVFHSMSTPDEVFEPIRNLNK